MNRLWKLVNDRMNYLTPTKKPVGYGTDAVGRRKRLYDKPATRWTGSWQPVCRPRNKPQNWSRTATR